MNKKGIILMRHQRSEGGEYIGNPQLVKVLKTAPPVDLIPPKPKIKTRWQKMTLCEFIRSMSARSPNARAPRSINK